MFRRNGRPYKSNAVLPFHPQCKPSKKYETTYGGTWRRQDLDRYRFRLPNFRVIEESTAVATTPKIRKVQLQFALGTDESAN